MKPAVRPLLPVVILAFLLVMTVSAQVDPNTTPGEPVRWLTYVDPRFDFSLMYPEDWTISPRADLPDSFGERLILTAPFNAATQDMPAVQIEIGLYLKEKLSKKDIAEWSTEYDTENDVFDHNATLVLKSGALQSSHSRKVYFKEAISPLTPYTYMNVPHGNVVWGFWMNSISDEYQAILEKMVLSLSFGPHSPRTLKQAYGNLPQLDMPVGSGSDQALPPFNSSEFSPAQLVGYKVPVVGPSSISCGNLNAPLCGGTHKYSAQYAIDLSASAGTSVYAVSYSILASTQFSNTGYGNLLKMRDLNNGYYAFYAH